MSDANSSRPAPGAPTRRYDADRIALTSWLRTQHQNSVSGSAYGVTHHIIDRLRTRTSISRPEEVTPLLKRGQREGWLTVTDAGDQQTITLVCDIDGEPLSRAVAVTAQQVKAIANEPASRTAAPRTTESNGGTSAKNDTSPRSSGDNGWTARAVCKSGDPDELFVWGAIQNRTKLICRSCPVRTECLADALDNRIGFGIWGGLTERERRALLRRRADVTSWRELLEAARTRYVSSGERLIAQEEAPPVLPPTPPEPPAPAPAENAPITTPDQELGLKILEILERHLVDKKTRQWQHANVRRLAQALKEHGYGLYGEVRVHKATQHLIREGLLITTRYSRYTIYSLPTQPAK